MHILKNALDYAIFFISFNKLRNNLNGKLLGKCLIYKSNRISHPRPAQCIVVGYSILAWHRHIAPLWLTSSEKAQTS